MTKRHEEYPVNTSKLAKASRAATKRTIKYINALRKPQPQPQPQPPVRGCVGAWQLACLSRLSHFFVFLKCNHFRSQHGMMGAAPNRTSVCVLVMVN